MDAKEAIEIIKNSTDSFDKWWKARLLAISALEKVETLEVEIARLRKENDRSYEDMTLYKRQVDKLVDLKESLYEENARLRELAFNHCSLHGGTFGNTSNYQKMFCDGKCEGYCRGVDNDEPIDECKECIILEKRPNGKDGCW